MASIEQQEMFTDEEARVRTLIYLEQRLDNQIRFYRRRIAEFQYNSNAILVASAIIMGFSTMMSIFALSSSEPWAMFITAILPALATALASFRAVYQWERQKSLYEDTILELRRARLVLPDTDHIRPEDYANAFPLLLHRAEDVFQGEAGQWGQLRAMMPSVAAKLPGASTTPPVTGDPVVAPPGTPSEIIENGSDS